MGAKPVFRKDLEAGFSSVEGELSALLTDWTANETMPNEMWAEMSKVYKEEAESKIGFRKNKPKTPYISDEVFQLAKDKSDARTRNEAEYKRLKKEVRQKIRRDKKAWLEHECSLITQANIDRKSKVLFQQIRKVKSQASQVRNQSINSKDGTTRTEMEDVLNRWHEYGTELFDRDTTVESETLPDLTFDQPEPSPLLDEIKAAIKQLKSGKSPGLDGIPAELLKHTGEAGVKALHFLCTRI